ncbi:MAG: hypothetical protein AAFQ41_17130 [Cyanobacteria bacterium J06623_7]
MNKINQFLKLEKAAVLIAVVGSAIWVLSFYVFFVFIVGDKPWLAFKPDEDLSPWDDIVFLFLMFWIPMPLVSWLGILSGCRYIWRRGFSIIAAFGVLLNIAWFAVFATYGTFAILTLT